MIGLEFILVLHKVHQKDLANELGIKKQNINLWISGKQKISKKYLPILSNKFDVSVEFLQNEVNIDKIMKHIKQDF